MPKTFMERINKILMTTQGDPMAKKRQPREQQPKDRLRGKKGKKSQPKSPKKR
jgi:hypothetical protein